MIHTHQVKNAVQHEHRDLFTHRVMVLGRLLFGFVERNSDLAQNTILVLEQRKREHIRRVVFFSKLAIQTP